MGKVSIRTIVAVAFLLSAGAPVPAHSQDVFVLTRASGLPSDWVRALAEDNGKIWVGTGDRGVALWDPSRSTVRDFSGEPGFTSKAITSIAVFRGKVFVGTTLELMVFGGDKWERMEKAGGVTLRNLALGASPDGKELWAGAMTLAGGTVKYDGAAWTFMGGEGRGLFNDIDSFAFDPAGTWMGALSGTVYLHKGASGVDFFPEGLSGNVSSLAKAGDTLFAGTNMGLFRMEGTAWKAVPFPEGWGTPVVFSMTVRGDALYLGTSAGLVRLKGKRMDRLTEQEGLPARKIEAVLAGEDAVYAGTAKGLAVVRGW